MRMYHLPISFVKTDRYTMPHAKSTPSSDEASDEASTTTAQTTRAGLSGLDPVLCAAVERARSAVAEGARAKATFKYDMNSRCVKGSVGDHHPWNMN